MLTLESFKLLNPKVGQLERSTGGTPEITFQEVADVLSRCTRPVSVYARWNYGLEDTFQPKLVDAVIRMMIREGQTRKRPLLGSETAWRRVVELGVKTHRSSIWLTRQQRKSLANVRRWTRRHDEALRNVRSLLDEWDYELRCELGTWNRAQLEPSYG